MTRIPGGLQVHPLYAVWISMHQRCSNPSAQSYERYGGRGISVCDRWKKFENFYADMGERPSPDHSLDRIDNDGNYEPENCRWATGQEQCNNQQRTRLLTAFGKTLTVAEWARQTGISYNTIRKRLRLGWPSDRALTR